MLTAADRLEAANLEAEAEEAAQAALPQNRFAKSFKQFSKSVGDGMRTIDADGKLSKRSGKSHPNTRTSVNMVRTGYLRHPPRRGTMQGHSTHNYATTICKTTAERVTRDQVQGYWSTLRQTRKTPANTKHALLSKTSEETEFAIHFSEIESRKWLKWQMSRINRERYLTKEDVEKLSDIMESCRVGIAHILSQHVMLCFGPGNSQPNVNRIVVPACSVQRTSASNLYVACEALPFPETSFQYFKDRVLEYLGFGLVQIGTDEGPGPERFVRETHELFHSCANCAVWSTFCRGHVVGGSAGEALAVESILSFMIKLSQCCRQHDTFKLWQASQAVQSKARIGKTIIRASDGDHQDEVRSSNEFWDRIAPLTILRECNTSARSHILEPQDSLSEEEQREVDATIKALEEIVAELKILVQIDSSDFRLAKHICFVSVCGSFCTPSKWLLRFNKAWSRLMSRIMPGRGLKIAKTRFLTWQNMLAHGSLPIMCAYLGPETWLDKWNVDETEEDINKQQKQLRNNETDDNEFRAEEAETKHSVSKGWSSNFMMAMYSTSNAVIFHIDSLYRCMDRCDATANRGKYPPLLLQLASPLATRNPIKVFYCKVGEMFSPQSDVNWMIRRWLVQFKCRTSLSRLPSGLSG